MNREIKFRGFNQTSKKMMDLNAITPLALSIDQDGLFIPFGLMPLMQYTGLKDKNGKEIFEGDIIKYELPDLERDEQDAYTEYTEEVVFQDGVFMLEVMPVYAATDTGEVIGNIYENPELNP